MYSNSNPSLSHLYLSVLCISNDCHQPTPLPTAALTQLICWLDLLSTTSVCHDLYTNTGNALVIYLKEMKGWKSLQERIAAWDIICMLVGVGYPFLYFLILELVANLN